MSSKVGVLRFPGTNCDRDVFEALETKGRNPEWLWHADRFDPKDYSALYLPGGFSYGDYLRSGALAARAPVMTSVREAASRGTPILGICNGFQILCEAGLLPGALVRNKSLRFIDDWVGLKLENSNSTFLSKAKPGHRAKLPIAHADGRFVASDDEIKRLQDQAQVWWTYESNPNGATADIAGVMSANKNVAALMPHPERAMIEWMGGQDGAGFFDV